MFVRSYRIRSRFVCSAAATAFAPAAAEQTLVDILCLFVRSYRIRSRCCRTNPSLLCAIISRFFAWGLLMPIPMWPASVVVSVSSPVSPPT